jgi:hypothetical protein
MRMKQLALAVGMACFVGAAQADLESDAYAHVYVDVVSNIAVQANSSLVDAGDVQTGLFNATIEFRVDANHEDVDLACYASDLWKGDDPTGYDVPPIPLYYPAGCLIDPINANPTEGASPIAYFDDSKTTTIYGFPSYGTNAINFESSQNGHFSQEVYVTVYWDQDDPEKPKGEYSGVVALYGMIPDGDHY